jgi:hypothetical protein
MLRLELFALREELSQYLGLFDMSCMGTIEPRYILSIHRQIPVR